MSLTCFSACGKKKEKEDTQQTAPTQNEEVSLKDTVLKVDITMENLFDYFQYKEFYSNYKQDDGTVTSVNIAITSRREIILFIVFPLYSGNISSKSSGSSARVLI